MKISAVLVLFLLGTAAVCGAPKVQQEQGAIDRFLEQCIEKDGSTAGMTQCTYRAYDMWDKEMNRAYRDLMRRLDSHSRETLKESQQEWLKFRDAEFKVVDSVFARLEGSMYIPVRVNYRLELVKKRALELSSYADLLKEAQ